ncbi:rho guanine nucleotide exchange factor 12-like isoform X1 [Styela clava]
MDTQSTVSSLAERLGSKRDKTRDHHYKDHRLSKADIGGPISTTDKEQSASTESLGKPLMVLKAVVIHRDDKGYGLTVSGDNPVFVQSVKENGAAHTAGVRQGDRIVKVNGTNVTDSNHIEVVKLIKSGQYVALTLLGPSLPQTDSVTSPDLVSSSGQPSSRPQSMVVKDTSFHDEKVKTIKKMVEQEKLEVERIKEEYAKDPNKKLIEDLGTAQKLLQDLEKQLWKIQAESSRQAQDIPIQLINEHNMRIPDATGDMADDNRMTEVETSDTEVKRFRDPDQTTGKDAMSTEGGHNENTISHNNSNSDRHKAKDDVGTQRPIIMNFEEEELFDQADASLDHGPFQDFDKLKVHPAHTAVFLYYVFRSHDPCALLLVLSVEQHKLISNTKELNKSADNISKTYINSSAILRFNGLDDGIAKSIVEAIQSKSLSEEALRSVFDPAVQHALKTVKFQLEQFCVKRDQGLTHCFGEDKVTKNMDFVQETKIVEEILAPLMQDLGQPQAGIDDTEAVKNTAKLEVLEKLLSQWTGKRKSKITSRVFGSMLRTRPVQMRPKAAGSMESIIDDPNKRISIFEKKFGKKKTTSGTASLMLSTVIPVMQTTQQDSHPGDGGHVSQMIGKFQDVDNNKSASTNNAENSDVLDVPGTKKSKSIGRSGSFRGDKRHRSATGKSNSDPDSMAVESAIRGNGDTSSQMSNSNSTSSMVSTGSISLSGSQTSGSLSSTTYEDMIAPLIAANPELEVEPDYQWSQMTPRDVIKQQDKKEIKRQEIISELLHTEKHHVRDLLIINLLFYNKMQSEGGLSQEDLFTVFPNLQEILSMHRKLKDALIELKQKDGHVIVEISHVLLEMFDGDRGEKFKNECAKYCGNQTAALEFIKERCKKDQKFNSFIQMTEKHPICRRLQLKDYVPIEFQRLTKYPLLLENIIKNTKKKDEAGELRKVQKQCKAILSYVNKAVKAAEDHQKIVEIQKNLDASSLNKVNHPIAQEYKNINLTERKLVHQGPLTWRITQTEKKKSVVLHCVLFEDIMVLLQKQDEKYVLKCHTSTTSKDLKSTVQPPILKLSKIFVRNVATDKRAFFLVSTSEFGAQIYELVAMTSHETQEWLKIVQSTSESAKKNDATSIRVPTTSRRSAFMVPETSRPIQPESPPNIEKHEDVIKEQEITKEQLSKETVLGKIQGKHDEIFEALEQKHNLLASYAGIESTQLENVLDMSLEDSSADPDTVVLHTITCTKRLTMMLNDALSPDTVFLPPTAPPVLLPTPESINSKMGSSTPTHKSESDGQLEKSTDEKNSTDDTIETNWTENESMTENSKDEDKNLISSSSLDPVSSNIISDRLSNASLDLVGSDYETASEPGSPSPEGVSNDAENIQSPNEIVSQIQEVFEEKEENTTEDLTSLSSADAMEEGSAVISDAGVDIAEEADAESDNTLSAAESLPTPKLVSPIDFDDNLLDFGSQAIAPDISISTSTSDNTSGVLSRASSLDVTKMLGLTYQLESQLIHLLRTVKEMTEAKQKLEDENSQLITKLNQMDSTASNVSAMSNDEQATTNTNDKDTPPSDNDETT